MKLFFDIDSRKLIQGVGNTSEVGTIHLKRGDLVALQLVCIRDGAQVQLTEGWELVFVLKEKGKNDSDPLAVASAWTESGEDETAVYSADLQLHTVELDTLFVRDGDASNDVESVTVAAEIQLVEDGRITSSRNFQAAVENDYWRGSEGDPTAATPDKTYLKFVDKDADYELVGTDHWKVITFTAAATLTLPDGLPVGYNCVIRNRSGDDSTVALTPTTPSSRMAVTEVGDGADAYVMHEGNNAWSS